MLRAGHEIKVEKQDQRLRLARMAGMQGRSIPWGAARDQAARTFNFLAAYRRHREPHADRRDGINGGADAHSAMPTSADCGLLLRDDDHWALRPEVWLVDAASTSALCWCGACLACARNARCRTGERPDGLRRGSCAVRQRLCARQSGYRARRALVPAARTRHHDEIKQTGVPAGGVAAALVAAAAGDAWRELAFAFAGLTIATGLGFSLLQMPGAIGGSAKTDSRISSCCSCSGGSRRFQRSGVHIQRHAKRVVRLFPCCIHEALALWAWRWLRSPLALARRVRGRPPYRLGSVQRSAAARQPQVQPRGMRSANWAVVSHCSQ